MTPTRLMLVDDHSIVRDGIRLLLEQADGLEIIDEAQDWAMVNEIEKNLEQLKLYF